MMIDRIISIFSESSKSFEGQEKGEEVVLLLRRHPFIALLPVSTLGLFCLVPIFIFFIFYSYIVANFLLLFLFASSVYLMIISLNTVILTDRRIIEREQSGFFNRKVSELHIYRIQDITVSTKGVLPTMIHYGDIIVQTAGMEQSFIFKQIPRPEEAKNAIMRIVSMANAGVKPQPEGVNN